MREASASPFLAGALEPALVAACDGRLRKLAWFRTDWQRGGALTGYAEYVGDAGECHCVVVKAPLRPVELTWLRRLQADGSVAPRLYASGDTLGPYDLAWAVMERLPVGPLGAAWGGREVEHIARAVVRFYKAAAAYPCDGPVPCRDWEHTLALSREKLKLHSMANEARWGRALKAAQKCIKEWVRTWQDRPTLDWCHGDLHPPNAMARCPAPEGPAVLLDYALTHVGHWVEDAVYFEHLFWSKRHRLGDRKPTRLIAQERKQQGLPVDADWPRFAQVRRVLLALATPANLDQYGDPAHIDAALQVLESEV